MIGNIEQSDGTLKEDFIGEVRNHECQLVSNMNNESMDVIKVNSKNKEFELQAGNKCDTPSKVSNLACGIARLSVNKSSVNKCNKCHTPTGDRQQGYRHVRSSSTLGSGLRRARVSPLASPESEEPKRAWGNISISSLNESSSDEQLAIEQVESTETSVSSPLPISQSSFTNNISNGLVTYPLVYVSSAGTISAILASDFIIEMSVNRSIRIVHHNHFAVYISDTGNSSAVLHRKACVVHTSDAIYSKFISSTDKLAIFGNQGVLFTMGHLTEAYLINSHLRGASAIQLDKLSFPTFQNDCTLKMFYSEAQTGSQFTVLCNEIVDQAMYDRKSDGSLIMEINGLSVKKFASGNVVVDSRPRHFTYDASSNTVSMRTSSIDISIQASEKAYVKSGTNRVHVSKSGMVVSDGNCITSMDHFGRILSCTTILSK